MTGSNAALQLSASAPLWSPPILPATYPDRHPRLTDAEKTLMEQYATAPAEFMTGGRARNVLHHLARFDTPFMDIVKLTTHMDTTVVAARRHLFTYMVQTGLAFWAWPKEIWVEVIQAGPGRTHTSGTRFWMLLLAYLFCDVLYVGAFTAYGAMAEVTFGQSVVAAEVDPRPYPPGRSWLRGRSERRRSAPMVDRLVHARQPKSFDRSLFRSASPHRP
jgi:hypothetical protein